MSEGFVGEIRYFGGSYASPGWEPCDGRQLSIANDQVLFALIGTTYGGDGVTTFALPDLRSRIPVHQGTGAGSSYTTGQTGGAETVTLGAGNLPPHTHPLHAAAASATTAGVQNMVPASWADTPYAPASAGTPQPLGASPGDAAGGNQPHNNIPPSLAVGYMICLQGIFPSRP